MSIKHRMQAINTLIAKYCNIFMFSWKNRSKNDDNFFNIQEAEFLPAALSIQEKPASPTIKLVIRSIILLLIIITTWAIFGKTDVVINATGKVIASGHTKTISSVEVGKITAINVKDGQKVRMGDVLIELDVNTLIAEKNKALSEYEALIKNKKVYEHIILIIEKGKNQSQISDSDIDVYNRVISSYDDYFSKISKINKEIKSLYKQIDNQKKIVKDLLELKSMRIISDHEYIEKLNQLEEKISQRDKLIDEKKIIQSEMLYKARENLAEINKTISTEKQEIIRAESRKELLSITSPIDGIVNQISVHTIGGTVPANQPIMLIVPESDSVEIEGFVLNKDIGFVNDGQNVIVKIDAFEYTKYGTISGKITRVSNDAINDEKQGLLYPIKVLLSQNYLNVDGEKKFLNPGMQTSIEIKLGKRRLIEYFLSPVLKYKQESLNER